MQVFVKRTLHLRGVTQQTGCTRGPGELEPLDEEVYPGSCVHGPEDDDDNAGRAVAISIVVDTDFVMGAPGVHSEDGGLVRLAQLAFAYQSLRQCAQLQKAENRRYHVITSPSRVTAPTVDLLRSSWRGSWHLRTSCRHIFVRNGTRPTYEHAGACSLPCIRLSQLPSGHLPVSRHK